MQLQKQLRLNKNRYIIYELTGASALLYGGKVAAMSVVFEWVPSTKSTADLGRIICLRGPESSEPGKIYTVLNWEIFQVGF